MIRRFIPVTAAFAVVSALALAAATPAPAQTAQEQDAQMKAWMEAAAPGANHQMLAKLAGNWDGKVTSYDDPTDPTKVTVTQGTAVKTMLFDGRFLQEEMSGEMMGMPFKGMGITGFDNVTKKFQVFWIDSMGTMMMHGDGDLVGDALVMNMSFVEPIGKQKMTAKGVTRIVDENKHTYTMYMVMGGNEMKAMEVEYTRKK